MSGFRFMSLKSFFLLFLLLTSATASAATWVVDTLTDELDASCAVGDCSLREAVAYSASGDTITFGIDGTFSLTRTGGGNTTGDFDISQTLTIVGNGQSQTIIDAAGLGASPDRIFQLSGNITLSLQDLTVQNGNASIRGGAILVGGTATTTPILNLTRVTVASSISALSGGGIACNTHGNVTITDSIHVHCPNCGSEASISRDELPAAVWLFVAAAAGFSLGTVLAIVALTWRFFA